MLSTVTFACLSFLPQGGTAAAAAEQKPVLTAAEQKSLHDKLAKMIDTRNEYDSADDRQREKAAKRYAAAKEAFQKEWDNKVEKKGDLMKSFVDLQAIFENCFTYPRASAASIRKENAKDGLPAYSYAIPKSYKPDVPTRTVLMLPGRDEKGWIEGRDWFGLTWDKTEAVDDTIFHIPAIGDIDLDPAPDYGKVGADAQETQRIAAMLRSFGELQRNYNVDRSRLFLDAGKDACAFALRVANHFPDRFAGVILRHPTEVDGIRIGSLNGLPILLLKSAATAAACDALEKRINALSAGQCTVIDGKGEYPFAASAADIDAWMDNVRRQINRQKVVLEPNDDRFCKGYWVAITGMDTIFTAPPDKKPRVAVQADPAANRITVDAVGVESVELLLNDALIDLDKEFTVVVNGKARSEKRNRDFNRMLEYALQKFDSDFLFPATIRVLVPKEEQKSDGEGGGSK